jgi:hypothetical protein
MLHPGHDQRATAGLVRGGQWLKAFVLQAAGARAQACDYCASAIPLGELRCPGCGATATLEPSKASADGGSALPNRQWLVPLLLCVLFPPALLVMGPLIFWRWLRTDNRGWILPLLVCLFFPPAVLLVAPALLWRSPGKRGAR